LGAQAQSAVLDATTASFTTAAESKLSGIEALADVTDATNVAAAGALMDSEVDVDIKTLSLPASTTITAAAATVLDDVSTAAMLTTLGAQAQSAVLDATTASFTTAAESKLSGIEALADVTDATNVMAAGALDKTLIPTEIMTAASDETTAIVTATDVMQFRMPYAMVGSEIRASLGSACSTGTFTVDVNVGGATVLSTKVTVDATEKTSTTAAIPAVLSVTAWADDAIVTIDVDGQGDGTATGLKITMIGTRSA
jgi:hypothetical protein